MPRQDSEDAQPGVLVEEPLDALHRFVQRQAHRVDRCERQSGVLCGQLADLASRPLRDSAIGQSHQLDAGWDGRETRPAEEDAGGRYAADNLLAARRRAPGGAVAFEDDGQRHGLALAVDVLPRPERAHADGFDQPLNGVWATIRQRSIQNVAQLGHRERARASWISVSHDAAPIRLVDNLVYQYTYLFTEILSAYHGSHASVTRISLPAGRRRDRGRPRLRPVRRR